MSVKDKKRKLKGVVKKRVFSLLSLRRMARNALRYAQRQARSKTQVNLIREGHWRIVGRLAVLVKAVGH